jgi:hypothetical protein
MKTLKALFAIALFILLTPACGGMGGDPPKDAGEENNDSGDVVNNDSDTQTGETTFTFTLPDSFTNTVENPRVMAVLFRTRDPNGTFDGFEYCVGEPTCTITIERYELSDDTIYKLRLIANIIPEDRPLYFNTSLDPETHDSGVQALFLPKRGFLYSRRDNVIIPEGHERLTPGDDITLDWGNNEWGLAPNGMYYSESRGGFDCNVTTEIKNDFETDSGETEIQIQSCLFRGAEVAGSTFAREEGNVQGEITTDLQTIHFTDEVEGETNSFTLNKMNE